MAQTGSLQVTISPASAITDGAKWQVDGGSFQNGGATVTNLSVANHTVSFSIISGWTTPANQSVSVSGNSTATTTVLYIPSTTPSDGLILLTNGYGIIQHGPWPQSLVNGKNYRVTAVPNVKNVFSNWMGGTTQPYSVLSQSANYAFTMQSNLLLEANFVTNPFIPATGIYNGLFTSTNGVTEQTAGMLKGLTIGLRGTYSGTLIINGGSHAISGAFNLAGQATNHISRPPGQGGALLLEMTLNLNESPPQVTGMVFGTNQGVAWVATNLLADLATNTLPSAQYTILILPDTNTASAKSPGGAGYALITNYAGTTRNPGAATARITGALADGTAFNQSVTVSQDGYVPIYANLYASKGLLLGWINLDLTNTTGVGITWIHPARTTGLYQNGFTNVLLTNQILLSPWTNSPTSIFAATNLSILDTINDTNALMDFTVTISNNFKLGEVSGPAPLSGCCINPKTGLLKVTIGSGANKLTGCGAISLNQTNGAGYFLTKTNAQAIKLGP